MPRCKAPEILRNEAYLNVRRNEPAPCLTRGRMRTTPQMGVFEQPGKTYFFRNLLDHQPKLI